MPTVSHTPPHTALKRSIQQADDEVERELVQELLGDVDAEGCASWLSSSTTPQHSTTITQESLTHDDKQCVWNDEHDDELRVDLSKHNNLKRMRKNENETIVSGTVFAQRLREEFTRVHSSTNWADGKRSSYNVDDDDDDDDDDEDINDSKHSSYLRSTQRITRQNDNSAPLSSGELQVMRLRDANAADYSCKAVLCTQFHPNAQLMLTAGSDKTLRLFHVDGEHNRRVQAMRFSDLPITTATFSANGNEVWLSGQRRYFYVYNTSTGSVSKVPGIRGRPDTQIRHHVWSPDNKTVAFVCDGGFVSLVSSSSKHAVAEVKMNGRVNDVSFSQDANEMYTFGSDGIVMVWDVRTRRCIQRFTDRGCVRGSKIAAAPRIGMFATGSDGGVVNLYSSTNEYNEPIKSVMSLTTEISSLAFNHDAQILAMASSKTMNALRLLHVPSCTVFSNWPTSSSPLHYVTSMAFSPHSGYLAVGNARGRVLLYRIKHFEKA